MGEGGGMTCTFLSWQHTNSQKMWPLIIQKAWDSVFLAGPPHLSICSLPSYLSVITSFNKKMFTSHTSVKEIMLAQSLLFLPLSPWRETYNKSP